MDEFELIRWIRERTGGLGRIPTGIGDDCAVLEVDPGARLLVTTDMLMDGRHFRLEECGARLAGQKAIGVNLSDIAAMAGIPLAAFVAVALPRSTARQVAPEIVEGMAGLLEQYGVALAGGDTNAWDGPLVICVTLIGRATDRGPLLRSGARPGDVIVVTGPLGGSLAGRHLRPAPRISEALRLHEAAPIQAGIDISDGLSSDLGHILEASGGLGATLDASAIPIHPDAVEMAGSDGRSALDHALNDGEDFELCLAMSEEACTRLAADPALGRFLHPVGVVEAMPGLRLRRADGSVEAIEPRGFNHFRADPRS